MTEKDTNKLVIYRLDSIDRRLDTIDKKLWILHGKAAAVAALVSMVIGGITLFIKTKL